MIALTINESNMTNNALEIENNELKKQLEFMQKKCYQQEQAYTQLLQSFKEAQRHRFGARSEKFIDLHVQQLDLFVLHDRQPHYHFEKKLIETIGFQCRRNKLSRWFIESGFAVQPLVNLSKDIIRYHDVAFCDPTSLQVLREPDRNPTTSSYVFCFRGGPADQGAVIYEYNASEHKLFLNDWFAEFRGYLHVDAQNIYDDLESTGRIKLVYCNTHAGVSSRPLQNRLKRKMGYLMMPCVFTKRFIVLNAKPSNSI
jgi:hypothetical protein